MCFNTQALNKPLIVQVVLGNHPVHTSLKYIVLSLVKKKSSNKKSVKTTFNTMHR